MTFKKFDIVITEQLTKQDIVEKCLPKLDAMQDKTNLSVRFIGNIHDIVSKKFYILIDSETRDTLGFNTNIIELTGGSGGGGNVDLSEYTTLIKHNQDYNYLLQLINNFNGGAVIDDSVVSTEKTWSSSKIYEYVKKMVVEVMKSI